MRRTRHRIVVLALGVAAVMSCDSRLPTALRLGQPGDPPVIIIDSPTVNTQVNLGDSIFVRASVVGGNGLKTLSLTAVAVTGDKDLGTYAETQRFQSVTVTFPGGTTDTIVRRYLRVLNPGDLTLDSLVIIGILTDSLGLADTSRVPAVLVSGPQVTIESPVAGDSIPSGVGVSITVRAVDADGIGSIQIRVTGDASWPTALDTTLVQAFTGGPRDVRFTAIVLIPANAPGRSRLTINASATDDNRQSGAAPPISLFIRSVASIAAPRVTPRFGRCETICSTRRARPRRSSICFDSSAHFQRVLEVSLSQQRDRRH